MTEEAYGKVDALNEDDVQTQEGHSTERVYTVFHLRRLLQLLAFYYLQVHDLRLQWFAKWSPQIYRTFNKHNANIH